MSPGKITSALFVLAATAGFFIFTVNKEETSASDLSASSVTPVSEAVSLKTLYDIPVKDYEIAFHKVKKGQFLGDLLGSYGIDQRLLFGMEQNYKDAFDERRLKAGNQYALFIPKGFYQKPDYFIYEINDVDYVVYDFTRNKIYTGAKQVSFKRKNAAGIIRSSLYKTFDENHLDPQLGMELSDIFAWVIDFYKLQQGDKFKVIYEEKIIDDKPEGVHRVLGAVFSHAGNDFYAFYFQPDSETGGDYFDESANSLRKEFLKAPLKFSRISSRYSGSRLHPVLKKYKPHLGVDYAAPTGTPILAVGDGIVTEAQYNRNNGNYVKIRHNSTYSTQYLHMSRFAGGIKPGAKVSQGQIIGYVGSTGLATGPHVCFRFWKNGSQVDPFKVQVPPSKPVDEKYRSEYDRQMASLKSELDAMTY